MDPDVPTKWPYTSLAVRAKLLQIQSKYPETEYKKIESKLAAAEEKILWWEKQVPKSIARELKIESLQDRVKELELKVKDV